MSITLQQLLTSGETAYISKHNSNYQSIQDTLNGLASALANSTASGATFPTALQALFGSSSAIIGTGYSQTTSGTTLTLQPGFYWVASTRNVVSLASASNLNFSGQAANTYYVKVDGLGTPYFDATSTPDALYSVVWSGTAFTTVTALVSNAPSFAQLLGITTSAAWATTYATAKARLEAIEAQVPQSNLQSVAFVATDVTLSQTQYNTRIIEATGVLTGNVNAIVPAGAREWIVANKTTGAFTWTIKTAAGTGITIASGKRAIVYADSVNVVRVTADV